MNSKTSRKKEKNPSMANTQNTQPTASEKRSVVSTQDRCRAVLSIWTERRTPSQVCRELGIAWTVLNTWQKRALEGMHAGLQPRTRTEKSQKPPLSCRLQSLLDKHQSKTSKTAMSPGIEKHLEKLEDTVS